MKLEGIHHVTAITGDVTRNVDFYTRILGLRLVAKSVNQDDPFVYHLFYSDETGSPGADLTFFDYAGAAKGRAGAGMVHRIVWRVGSPEALAFWEQRFAANDVPAARTGESLRFEDFEGLEQELVVDATRDDPRIAEHPEIPRDMALRGFDGVRAYGQRPERSRGLIEDVLGGVSKGDGTWEMRGAKRGGWITYDTPPESRGIPGTGTVHHVAWGTEMAEQERWLAHLQEQRVPSTEIVDRHYFRSIYFREPNGVLFELATDGPGFARDGSVEELGTKVILPPWFEYRRADIESRLTPIPDPRAGWKKSAKG